MQPSYKLLKERISQGGDFSALTTKLAGFRMGVKELLSLESALRAASSVKTLMQGMLKTVEVQSELLGAGQEESIRRFAHNGGEIQGGEPPPSAQYPSLIIQGIPKLEGGVARQLALLVSLLTKTVDWEGSQLAGRVIPNVGLHDPLDEARALALNTPTILAHMREDDMTEWPSLRASPLLEYVSRPLMGVLAVVGKRAGGDLAWERDFSQNHFGCFKKRRWRPFTSRHAWMRLTWSMVTWPPGFGT